MESWTKCEMWTKAECLNRVVDRRRQRMVTRIQHMANCTVLCKKQNGVLTCDEFKGLFNAKNLQYSHSVAERTGDSKCDTA